MRSLTYQDQFLVDKAAEDFILSKIPLDRHYEVVFYDLRVPLVGTVDGRVASLFASGKLIAQTTIIRDDFNFSVLTCIDLRENLEAGE